MEHPRIQSVVSHILSRKGYLGDMWVSPGMKSMLSRTSTWISAIFPRLSSCVSLSRCGPRKFTSPIDRDTNLRVRIVMVGAKTCFHSGTCCLSTPTFMVLIIFKFSNVGHATKISLRRCFVNDQEVIIFSCTSGTPLIGDPN